jgi:hypothetical protein
VHILADGCRIDIDMDNMGIFGKGGNLAGYPVSETAAHRNEQIGRAHGFIGSHKTVHADHAAPQGMRAGKTAQAHEGRNNGYLVPHGHVGEHAAGIGADHAAAHKDKRFFCLAQKFRRAAKLYEIGLIRGVIAA